jgi:hypothetical protein
VPSIEPVALRRRLGHALTLAQALLFETAMHALRRDIAAQDARAGELIVLSEAQGFPLWLGLGKVFQSVARVVGGEREAVAEVMEGFAFIAGTATGWVHPCCSVWWPRRTQWRIRFGRR